MNHVHDGLLDPKLTFFIDVANFNLLGYVNSQNKMCWSSKNPHAPNSTSPLRTKYRLWCAISARVFYLGVLDAERHINEILNPFFINLAPAEQRSSYFMQDGATWHTAKETIRALRSGFDKFNRRGGQNY
jgi:hypothetical protein